ncbi:hypothetical protein BH10PSE3_BH10PSE3_27700 [soil metagenome]
MTLGSKQQNRLALMMSATRLMGGLCVAGAGLTLISPNAANAASECGAIVGQTVTCSPGVYPTGVTYTPGTPLSLILGQTPTAAVTISNGGLSIGTSVADAITVSRPTTGTMTPASPSLSIVNLTGPAVSLNAAQGAITFDLRGPVGDPGFSLIGQTDGLLATTGGTINVLTNNGSITGRNGNAINLSAGGAVSVSTGANLVATNGAGLSVVQTGPTGAINVSTTGAITAGTFVAGDGIFVGAQDPTNTDTITVAAGGTISAGGTGIRVTSTGAREITISTTASADITALSDGVFASTTGNGAIHLNTAGDIIGDANSGGVGNAVNLISQAGSISLNTAAGSTLYVGAGAPPAGLPAKNVVSLTSTTGAIIVNNAAALQNTNVGGADSFSNGFRLRTAGGDINLTSSGAIGTIASPLGGVAIDAAVTAGAGNLTVTNSGALRSLGSAVVNLTNNGTGDIVLNSNGTIDAPALFAVQTTAGAGTSTLRFGANVTSTNSTAVRAISVSGAVNTTVANGVQVTGAGGFVLGSNSGALSLTNAGTISTAGTNIGAASAATLSTAGSASVVNTGTISAIGGASGTATLAFVDASSATLSNSGLITTGRADHDGFAVGFSSATTPTTLTWANNTGGTINGALFNGSTAALTFNNAGAWFTATTQSTFSSGAAGILNNTGLIQIGLTTASPAATTTTFSGLATFNNRGMVSLSNGVAGDRLMINGAYVGGPGAELRLDLASATSGDRLVISGLATGSTSVVISRLGTTNAFSNTPIVEAGQGSSPTAFVLADGLLRQGFMQYGIAYEASTSIYSLIQIPNTAAIETLKFAEIRRNMFDKAEGAWSSHLGGLRMQANHGEGVAEGAHVWGDLFGGDSSYNDHRSLTPVGVRTSYDLDYDQSHVGGQFGVDIVQGVEGGVAILGVTGGYAISRADFDTTRDRFKVKGFNVGGYFSYAPGSWFVNTLLRYDRGNGAINSSYADYRQSLKTSQFVATLEVGKAFERGRWFVEPLAGFTAGRGSVARKGDEQALNNYTVDAVTVALDDDKSLRGRLGLRVGTQPARTLGGFLTPYMGVAVVNEFSGKDGVTFNPSSTDTLKLTNRSRGTYGDLRAGAQLMRKGGQEFAAEATGEVGARVTGYGLRLRFRQSW